MQMIAERGFDDLRVAEVASELHCSVASLYKIAPSKDSLVMLAISEWGRRELAAIDQQASKLKDPAKRARGYFQAGARSMHNFSSAFRRDVDRYESTRLQWQTAVADPFIDRFTELLKDGIAAGEIRPLNTRFVAQLLRQIALVTRDESLISPAGLTAEEALLEVDALVWEGIRRG